MSKTNMSSLPESLAAHIVDSIKHPPVYKVKYTTINTIYDEDDEELNFHVQKKLVKLVSIEGNKEDTLVPSHVFWEGLCGCANCGWGCSIPAWIKDYDSEEETTTRIKTTDYLKPGMSWIGQPGSTMARTYIITSFERFA